MCTPKPRDDWASTRLTKEPRAGRRPLESGRAKVWDINDAYRTSGCRVGGHGIYHDHAFCARLPAAEAPAPAAPSSYPYLASYAVFLLSFASVRLLSSCTRRRETNHEQ